MFFLYIAVNVESKNLLASKAKQMPSVCTCEMDFLVALISHMCKTVDITANIQAVQKQHEIEM